jgi:hypothetical protein
MRFITSIEQCLIIYVDVGVCLVRVNDKILPQIQAHGLAPKHTHTLNLVPYETGVRFAVQYMDERSSFQTTTSSSAPPISKQAPSSKVLPPKTQSNKTFSSISNHPSPPAPCPSNAALRMDTLQQVCAMEERKMEEEVRGGDCEMKTSSLPPPSHQSQQHLSRAEQLEGGGWLKLILNQD